MKQAQCLKSRREGILLKLGSRLGVCTLLAGCWITAGFLLTVIGAWACALFVPWPDLRPGVDRRVCEGGAIVMVGGSRLGLEIALVETVRSDDDLSRAYPEWVLPFPPGVTLGPDLWPGAGARSRGIWIGSGFPFVAFARYEISRAFADGQLEFKVEPQAMYLRGLPLGRRPAYKQEWSSYTAGLVENRLPVFPITSGILLNTMILGVTLWSVWQGVRRSRSVCRRLRRQCLECGYPRVADSRCSECGDERRQPAKSNRISGALRKH